MQYSGKNEDQVGGLGEEYIEGEPNGYIMSEIEENLKNIGKENMELQKKIIEEARKNGYDAEYQEGTKRVVIASDKDFKMSVPVKKNHAVRFSNVTTEQKAKIKQEEMKEDIDSIIQNAVQKSEGGEKNKQVPYQPRANLPVPAEDEKYDENNNDSYGYEYIYEEKMSPKGDIYNKHDKESNNNESKKSQNSIISEEFSFEEI